MVKARALHERAQGALADESLAEKYTPLSPVYLRTSTGRRRALALWLTGAASENPLDGRRGRQPHLDAPIFTLRSFPASTISASTGCDQRIRNCSTGWPPNLLDSGWSMKHVHRLDRNQRRRLSGAPRQPATLRRTWSVIRENRHLWRMNAGRMESA